MQQFFLFGAIKTVESLHENILNIRPTKGISDAVIKTGEPKSNI